MVTGFFIVGTDANAIVSWRNMPMRVATAPTDDSLLCWPGA
jgi:hypothetical protein